MQKTDRQVGELVAFVSGFKDGEDRPNFSILMTKLEMGEYTQVLFNGGPCPYGYTISPGTGKPVVNPEEADPSNPLPSQKRKNRVLPTEFDVKTGGLHQYPCIQPGRFAEHWFGERKPCLCQDSPRHSSSKLGFALDSH